MKKNSFKRIAALLLMVIMITSCIPCIAFADADVPEQYTGNYVAYDLSGNEIGTVAVNAGNTILQFSDSHSGYNGTYNYAASQLDLGKEVTFSGNGYNRVFLVHNGGSKFVYCYLTYDYSSGDNRIALYPISYSGTYIANITKSSDVTLLSFRIDNYNLTVTDFNGDGNAYNYKDHIKGNTYSLFKHDDTVTYNEIECYCDTFKRDNQQAFELYFNKKTNECVGFDAQFQYDIDAEGTCGLQAPQKAASTGYSITFDSAASKATITGDKLPSKIYVKEDGSTSDPQEIDDNSFVFENKVYEITFTVDGNAYTMHANCKTNDVQFTTDTRYLEDVVADMYAYLDYCSRNGGENILSNSDNLPLGEKIYCPSSVYDNSFVPAYVAATGVLHNEKSDQSDIDAAANDARKATNAFFNNLVLPYVKFDKQSTIVPIDYLGNTDIDVLELDYAVGLFASRAEVPSGSIAPVGNGITYTPGAVYTLFTTEKLFGKERSSVSYFAVKLCDLQTWIKANVSKDQKGKLVEYVPYIDNSGDVYDDLSYEISYFDDFINAYFDVTKPEPQQGQETHHGDPAPEKTITDLVEFTVSGDAISWKSLSDSVVVERVSYALGKTTDVGGSVDAKYMPLPESENSFKALKQQEHTIKMLLRTGDTVKTFYYLVEADKITADCNPPIVQKYAGAVAAYSRGFEATSIAYVKGTDYADLAAAKAAEIADQSTVKVYYVKDGATLDSTAFAPDSTYTFFFVGASETKTLEVEF